LWYTPGMRPTIAAGIPPHPPAALPRRPQVERWVQCYRSAGDAPLPDPVRGMLVRERKRGRRRMLLPWLIPLLAFIAPLCALIAVVQLAPKADALAMAMLVTMLIAPLVGGGLAILLCNDGMKVARGAKKDLRHGKVERFVLDTGVLEELAAARAVGLRVAPMPQHLTVLPISSRLCTEDDHLLATFRPVTIAHLASSPDDAPLEPVELRRAPPSHPQTPQDLEGYATAQRSMTAAERQELSKLRWRIMRAWFLLPIPLGIIALGAASLIHGRTTIWQAPLWGFWIVLLVICIPRLVRTVQVWLALGRDLRDGRMLVLENQDLRSLLREFDLQPAPVLPQSAEHLPVSGMVWTSDGTPAPWRSHVQAKQK
jgi:hypothetical protein